MNRVAAVSGFATPRVSVLVPMRDAATTLPACLRSIAAQSYADFECLLVDDGSRDDSCAVAAAFARRDPRFVLHRRPPLGLVAALQFGVSRCRGEFVARMDADDLMRRARLARQVAALDASPEVALVGCHVRLFPRPPGGTGRRDYEAWLNSLCDRAALAADALIECALAHPTWLVRRSVLARFGYRDVPWAEDYDLVLRLLAAGCALDVVPERLLAWRDHGARLSRRDRRYALAAFVRARAHFLACGFLARAPRYLLWGYGSTGKALALHLTALRRLPAAIIELHPGRIGNRILGAPVVAPTALPQFRGLPLLVSVAGAGPRAEIRAELSAQGWREGREFVCVA